MYKVISVIGFLLVVAACVPEKSGMDRIVQLCSGQCYTATLTQNAQFEPDPDATTLDNQWGLIQVSQTIPAGLIVQVAAIMPDGMYPKTALVGWINDAGHAQVGWVDDSVLGNWSPDGVGSQEPQSSQ
jgi:hypothetical protein